MERNIVVVLRRGDEVAKIMPYLEDLVRPGVKVVFLVPYPLEPSRYLRDYWVITESTRQAIAAGQNLSARYSWERQRRLAEERVLAESRSIRALGAEVSVELCSGALKNIAEKYSAGGHVLLLMSVASVSPIRNLFRESWRLFRKAAKPKAHPVLLFDLSRGAGLGC